MTYLARKITLSKWEEVNGGISSDVLGACLRTTENQLSFWIVNELTTLQLENVILGVTANAIKVIDTATGKIYDTIKIAAIDLNIPNSTLTCKLSGYRTNNTTLKYYINE